jgi:hypothetical protein
MLNSELSCVDDRIRTENVCEPKEAGEDDAGEFIWAGILATANYIRKRQPFLPRPRRKVVKLREGSTEAPLYFIGGGLTELRLSQIMKVDRAIYAVEVPWPSAWRNAAQRKETAALPNMEELAAAYTKALALHVRSSRCVLAGFSFYGLIAFEVAHQLSAAGLKVELVMLLDAQAIYLTPWQKLIKDWSNCRMTTVGDLRSLVHLFVRLIIPDARYPTTILCDDIHKSGVCKGDKIISLTHFGLSRGSISRESNARESGPYRRKPGLGQAVRKRIRR